jgi:hypothetical protein
LVCLAIRDGVIARTIRRREGKLKVAESDCAALDYSESDLAEQRGYGVQIDMTMMMKASKKTWLFSTSSREVDRKDAPTGFENSSHLSDTLFARFAG